MILREDQGIIMGREPSQTLRSMAGCQQVEPEHFPLDSIFQSLVEVGIFLPYDHVAPSRYHHALRLEVSQNRIYVLTSFRLPEHCYELKKKLRGLSP
jgi:hypothetical protein